MTDTYEKKAQHSSLLSAGELRWMLDHMGLETAPYSPLAELGNFAPEGNKKELRDRGVLDEAWEGALSILANSDHQVRSIIPGPDEMLISLYYADRSKEKEGLVGCWVVDDRILVSFPWSVSDIVTLAVEVLMSVPLFAADSYSATLSLPGLITLGGAVDVVREAVLSSLLERRVEVKEVFEQDELARQIERGMTENDARWIVTLLRLVGPPGTVLAPDDLGPGLRELIEADLVSVENGLWRPTDNLQRFAVYWKSPLPAVAHEAVSIQDGKIDEFKYRVTLRGTGPLWIIDYSDSPEGSPQAAIRSMGSTEYLKELTDILNPSPLPAEPRKPKPKRKRPAPAKPPPKRRERAAEPKPPETAEEETVSCSQCQGELRPGAKFCTNCGAPTS